MKKIQYLGLSLLMLIVFAGCGTLPSKHTMSHYAQKPGAIGNGASDNEGATLSGPGDLDDDVRLPDANYEEKIRALSAQLAEVKQAAAEATKLAQQSLEKQPSGVSGDFPNGNYATQQAVDVLSGRVTNLEDTVNKHGQTIQRNSARISQFENEIRQLELVVDQRFANEFENGWSGDIVTLEVQFVADTAEIDNSNGLVAWLRRINRHFNAPYTVKMSGGASNSGWSGMTAEQSAKANQELANKRAAAIEALAKSVREEAKLTGELAFDLSNVGVHELYPDEALNRSITLKFTRQ